MHVDNFEYTTKCNLLKENEKSNGKICRIMIIKKTQKRPLSSKNKRTKVTVNEDTIKK